MFYRSSKDSPTPHSLAGISYSNSTVLGEFVKTFSFSNATDQTIDDVINAWLLAQHQANNVITVIDDIYPLVGVPVPPANDRFSGMVQVRYHELRR